MIWLARGSNRIAILSFPEVAPCWMVPRTSLCCWPIVLLLILDFTTNVQCHGSSVFLGDLFLFFRPLFLPVKAFPECCAALYPKSSCFFASLRCKKNWGGLSLSLRKMFTLVSLAVHDILKTLRKSLISHDVILSSSAFGQYSQPYVANGITDALTIIIFLSTLSTFPDICQAFHNVHDNC